MFTKAGGVEIKSGGYCSFSGDITGDANVGVCIGISAGIGGLTKELLYRPGPDGIPLLKSMVITGVDCWLTLWFRLLEHCGITAVMVVLFDAKIAGAESKRDSFGGR